jgi:hypothetical protein
LINLLIEPFLSSTTLTGVAISVPAFWELLLQAARKTIRIMHALYNLCFILYVFGKGKYNFSKIC